MNTQSLLSLMKIDKSISIAKGDSIIQLYQKELAQTYDSQTLQVPLQGTCPPITSHMDQTKDSHPWPSSFFVA